MPDKKFDLGDYVEVKDRIAILYELFPQARLVTDDVVMLTAPDNKQRVMVKALAYRTPDDPHPGVGYSWMELPGTTTYTRGSELENTETSAWGRAIASLGILIDKSIASGQEVANKQTNGAAPERPTAPITVGTQEVTPDGGLIGTAEVGKGQADFELRQTPDGMKLEFRLTSPRGGIKVVAIGPLAEALHTLKASVVGQRITAWGRIQDVTYRPKSSTRDVTYQVLRLSRIQTPTFTLPAPDEPVLEEPPDDIELAGEAPSVELGLVS